MLIPILCLLLYWLQVRISHMKKIIALICLFLANFVILVHAIIPHHHHDGAPVSICYISDPEIHKHYHEHLHHTTDSDEHDHSKKPNEDCLLSGLYLSPDQNKQMHLSSVDTDLVNSPSHLSFFTITPICNPEIKDYGNLPFRKKPYLLSSYNYFTTHSSGLRAPPVC